MRAPLVLPSPSSANTDAPLPSQPMPMQCFPLEKPPGTLEPSGILGWSASGSGYIISSISTRPARAAPSCTPSSTASSLASQYGGVVADLRPDRAAPARLP